VPGVSTSARWPKPHDMYPWHNKGPCRPTLPERELTLPLFRKSSLWTVPFPILRTIIDVMPDVHTSEQRSRNMRAIKSRDSRPEMIVRRLLHSNGYRYRLHDTALPGTPDIVFPAKRKVIFVNGCFWHSHACAHGQVAPATNAEFWANKRERTVARDQEKSEILLNLGWKVLVVWECQCRDPDVVLNEMSVFLGQR